MSLQILQLGMQKFLIHMTLFFLTGLHAKCALIFMVTTQALWKFEAWRWLVFIAGTVPLYGVSRLVMHLLVVGLESHFVARGALYYVLGLRVRILFQTGKIYYKCLG